MQFLVSSYKHKSPFDKIIYQKNNHKPSFTPLLLSNYDIFIKLSFLFERF